MSNVSLGARLMAERMSLPYLDLRTCHDEGGVVPGPMSDCPAQDLRQRHIVLAPDQAEAQSDPSLYTHVHLLTANVVPQAVGAPSSGPCVTVKADKRYPCNHDVISATYRVDLAPPTGHDATDTYLLVTQKYEFYEDFNEKQITQLACEPAHGAPGGGVFGLGLDDCGRWKPMVQYEYHRGNSADVLESLNAAARLHFTPDAVALRGEAFFRDCDDGFPGTNCGGSLPTQPQVEKNELQNETVIRAFSLSGTPPFNTIPGRYDNLHQTGSDNVGAPFPPPGCAPCVHMHWRWGFKISKLATDAGAAHVFGDGFPQNADGEPGGVYNPQAHQTLDVGVVTYHSNELSPFNFITDLVKGANPNDLNMSISNGQYHGGIANGTDTLNFGPAGCYAANAIESWGQCGVVAWLSATAYGKNIDSFGEGDEDKDTFFAFSGFFCASCSEPDYSDFLHLKPTYAPPHLSALKAGHPLTIKFGNLHSQDAFGDSGKAGDIKIFDLLPAGMTHPVVTTIERPGIPEAPINCSLTTQNGRTELVCDINNNDGSNNLPCVGTTCITVQGNVPTTPGPYDNTSHIVWQEALGGHIGGNLRQVDPITVTP